jgi:hypothetical protein
MRRDVRILLAKPFPAFRVPISKVLPPQNSAADIFHTIPIGSMQNDVGY